MRSNPPIRTETDWYAVLAAVLCGVVVAMNVGKVPIAMSQLRAEFGLSLVTAGWVSSTSNTLSITMALLFGVPCDRLGALRMCLTGLGFGILGGLGGLIAGNESALLLSRFADGVGVVSVVVSAPALLSSATTYMDRPFALGIWSAYLPAGVGLVMLLAPVLMPFWGWRGIWVLIVSLLSCMMVLANVPGNLLGGSLLQRNFRRGSLIAFASVVTGLCGIGIFLDVFPDLIRYGLCVLLSFAGGLIPASVLSASASLARTPKQIGALQGLPAGSRIGVESTGIYHELFANSAHRLGFTVSVQ